VKENRAFHLFPLSVWLHIEQKTWSRLKISYFKNTADGMWSSLYPTMNSKGLGKVHCQ
jgi:hypothetical protein